ncbi:MAG: hypothetical protein NWS10_03540 [Cyanobium sp. MAG_216]|nr:hypothetical protein [Cyanobium sp. MAG_216]
MIQPEWGHYCVLSAADVALDERTVICGKGYGYRRPDGVVVVPVGALGP